MNTVKHHAFKLPAETIAQLRALASRWKVKMAEALRRAVDRDCRRTLGADAPDGPPPIRQGRKKNVNTN